MSADNKFTEIEIQNIKTDKEMLIDGQAQIKTKGLTAFHAALAWLSTMIGAGLVGIPFAFYYLGLPGGLIVLILISVSTNNSSRLYFLTRELLGGLTSFSEIGFKLLGRKSIFFFNTIIFINCFGCLIIYYSIFGGIMSSIYQQLTGNQTSLLA